MALNVFENTTIFCIKCNMNRVCNGKCKYSLGCSKIHYSSSILSVSITAIVNGKYNNPMNIIFDEYFTISKIT